MKKKTGMKWLALGTAAVMLSAPASAATAEELMEKYCEAAKTVSDFSADIDLNFAVGIGISMQGVSMDMDVALLGELAMDYIKDPLSAKIDGSMKLTAPGSEEMSAALQLYLVPEEDSSMGCYVYLEEDGSGEWEYTAVPAEQTEQILNMAETSQFDFSSLPGTLTLGEEGVDVGGTACSELISTITYEELESVITEALKTTDEDAAEELESTLSLVSAALDGIQLNASLYLSEETSLPMKARIDFDGSDLTMLNQILAYSFADSDSDGNAVFPEVSLDISDLYLEITYDYTAPDQITVPSEGLAAKEDSADSNAFSDALEHTVEEIAG